ncbi:MAG: hypothetical protein M3Y87_13880 [Myxococcota bacterium]|nr:hypothetical protein [Myxococcota bacterium]
MKRLVALAIALCAGCGLSLDTPRSGPRNDCAADADCEGARCDAALGMCIADAITPYEYRLQIVLPASDAVNRPALATTAGPFVASSGDASSELAVRTPVPVVGRVRLGGDGAAVEAEITFTPRRRVIAPSAAPVSIRTLATDDTRDCDCDFATQLVPGTTYDVEVRPRGEDAMRLAPVRGTLDLTGGQRFDVAFLPTEAHFALRGTIVDGEARGQNGLEVRAIDPSGHVVSSIATTATGAAGEDGFFEIFVDPAATGWVLRVSAPPAYQENAAFPTITIDPAVLAYEGDDRRVRILVPSSDDHSVCFAGIVELPEELGGGAAVGATVTLRSREISDSVTRLVGSYSIQVVSVAGAPAAGPDERPIGCTGEPLPPGGFEARVVPGVYDVEIWPLEPELGVYLAAEPLPIFDETYGHVFAMPARPRLGGVVQRSADEPMIDARVRAVPLHIPLPLTSGERGAWRLNRPGETITDPYGNFRLPLDVGVYDLIAEPPEGSGYPWVVRPAFAMAAREWTEVLDVRHPVVVRGHASFDEGGEIAGAEITAYAIVGEPGAERAVPIARATSESDGSFLLLLPPQL